MSSFVNINTEGNSNAERYEATTYQKLDNFDWSVRVSSYFLLLKLFMLLYGYLMFVTIY